MRCAPGRVASRGALRITARAAALLTVLLAAPVATPTRADAQHAVTGRVLLLERPGRRSDDLATTVLWLEPVGDAPRGTARDTLPRRAAVAMRLREFIPHVRVVAAGGSVEFPNQDPFSHNVFSNTDLGRFDLGLYRRRDTRAATFRNPGVYAIYCNIHSKMSSFVVAVPTRHVAIADRSGAFTIGDVPPGTYVLRVWHERAPERSERLVVNGDVSSTVTLDARGYVAGPHLNKFGQPYATTRADRY